MVTFGPLGLHFWRTWELLGLIVRSLGLEHLKWGGWWVGGPVAIILKMIRAAGT